MPTFADVETNLPSTQQRPVSRSEGAIALGSPRVLIRLLKDTWTGLNGEQNIAQALEVDGVIYPIPDGTKYKHLAKEVMSSKTRPFQALQAICPHLTPEDRRFVDWLEDLRQQCYGTTSEEAAALAAAADETDEDTLAEAVSGASLDSGTAQKHVKARVDSPRLCRGMEPLSVVGEEGYTSNSSPPALLSSSDMSNDK
ncbi:hypothetical protein PHLGIDRAFT_119429 [Phlebiopsis gigantea 11061_1 CR5-6]|uniref:Uncharacterized protein n=1 Tax=Phlebiopsis gigantea (strain 11061_1 CR5-6) TaxID=745531 RepID=A0A0C3RWF0_PHLG1|nr:hypothetical protein PHLGIDRAFT_119429 [Phlebiopsis gigantea 11061_1 CR5-6]